MRFCAPASFGDLKRITSAGTLVAKPGIHGLGRACDYDAWTFTHVDIRPIKTSSTQASGRAFCFGSGRLGFELSMTS